MRFAGLQMLSPPVLSILVLLAESVSLSAQTHLKPGKTIEGDVSADQNRAYSVKLNAKRYVVVVVRQENPTLAIELHAPDGKKLLQIDTRDFPGKPTKVRWVTGVKGEYHLSVSIPGRVAKDSRYEIKLEKPRAANAIDRKVVEADRVFIQGLGEVRSYAYDQAIVLFTKAASLYREVQDREREGDALFAAGSACASSGKSDKAIDYYEQALVIRREIKDRDGEGIVLKNLGNAFFFMSQSEKSVSYQEEALTIFREVKDRDNEGRTLTNLGNAYKRLNEYEKALGYYQQSLVIMRKINDHYFEGATLFNIGGTYTSLSQYEKAITYFVQALTIARDINNRLLEGRVLNGIGWAYERLNQYEKAMGYLEQALAIEREVKDKMGESATVIDIGTTYANLGEYEKSITSNEQALAISRETRDRWAEGKALGNLGWSNWNLKQYDRVIGYAEQALAIQREIRDREGEAETLGVLAGACESLRQYQKAIGYHEQRLALARTINYRLGEARAINGLGTDYKDLGQNERALGYYQQGLAISRGIKERFTETDALSGLMEIWQALGKPSLAIFYGKQAVNTVQSIRSDIHDLGQGLQRSFVKDNEKPYHTLVEILIEEGRLAEAEQVLGLLKEEEYFQYIRRDAGEAPSLNGRANLTPDEADYEKRYREIGDRLMTIGVERGELLAKKTLTPEQSKRLTQLEQDLAVGNAAFEHFLSDLTQHFSTKPDFNTKVVEQLREEEGLMEDLRELPAGTVAIYTIVGEDKLYMILRTPDAQKAYEYPIKGTDLNRKVLEFRQAVQNPKVDPRPLAEGLYRIIVGPMANDLSQAKARTLMWSLDGVLRYLPLAALYDGQQYLIEQYRLSVMTLASNTRLLGNPDAQWRAVGFGVTKAYEGEPALPSVSAELFGIIATEPGDGGVLNGEIKLDSEFTREAMRQTLLKRYPVVHIASHFQFQPGNEKQSFLLLGDGSHLSLAELRTSANLFGGVQLLTLSACNTGIGDGTEVEGFGALAQRQGAKAVIASLWSVEDESTSRLMQQFYRIRQLSPDKTKLQALREAQLELLRGGEGPASSEAAGRGVHVENTAEVSQANLFPYSREKPFAHPYYWAPFFLMGNWL